MYFHRDLFKAFRELEPVTEGLRTQNSSMSQQKQLAENQVLSFQLFCSQGYLNIRLLPLFEYEHQL